MSQKRKHEEVAEMDAADPATAKKPRSFPHASKTRHKRPNAAKDKDSEYGASANALKNRIRDLKRLLAHVDNVPKHKMSASSRIERERELEACEHELEEKTMRARESEYRKKMIGKYHQVRFFDRQKATRVMKRLKKELAAAADEDEKSALQSKLHNAEVDVNYAISYPLMKPYSSLYPKSKKSSKTADTDDSDEAKSKPEDVDGPKGDVMVWKMVEQAMEEGTLEALRNSKSRDEIPGAPPKKSKAAAKTKAAKNAQPQPQPQPQPKPKKTYAPLVVPANRREARAAAREAEEDSDGGFFE
ncbi:18S rRNA maturation protein [Didymella heteroderae]|uniref:rRNA-processing protein EFG1 n=1 Tax=Didymella heteroderae TaxID=1769908 RepID=A0A9P5C0C1_9PLEO|nr:18S rRNA maturation protein [Didymella heteroderae]